MSEACYGRGRTFRYLFFRISEVLIPKSSEVGMLSLFGNFIIPLYFKRPLIGRFVLFPFQFIGNSPFMGVYCAHEVRTPRKNKVQLYRGMLSSEIAGVRSRKLGSNALRGTGCVEDTVVIDL